jgi:hypothetical protein
MLRCSSLGSDALWPVEDHRRFGGTYCLQLQCREGKPSTQDAILPSRNKTKLHGLSPQANYTNRATAACRRSDFQLLRIEGATWSA